jgi:phosphatidylinositol 4-kinase
MKLLKTIFKRNKCDLYLRPYEILITSQDSAIIEFIPDSISIHGLKVKLMQLKRPKIDNLRKFYQWYFNDDFEKAQLNFIKSLAAYSLFTYVF